MSPYVDPDLTSEQGAGLGGSEGVVAGGDPDQERVLGGILQTEVFELSSSLRHLRTGEHGQVVVLHVYLHFSSGATENSWNYFVLHLHEHKRDSNRDFDRSCGPLFFLRLNSCKKKLFFFLAIFRTLSLSGSVGVLRETSLVRQEDI